MRLLNMLLFTPRHTRFILFWGRGKVEVPPTKIDRVGGGRSTRVPTYMRRGESGHEKCRPWGRFRVVPDAAFRRPSPTEAASTRRKPWHTECRNNPVDRTPFSCTLTFSKFNNSVFSGEGATPNSTIFGQLCVLSTRSYNQRHLFSTDNLLVAEKNILQQ